MARIVVDPVSRIEGHLRIEANLDGGKISDAWSSGTMFRGIEMILQGRDPREAWIWAQRICGVCTMVHAIASVRAVEDALQIEVPENARLVRHLIAGCADGAGPRGPLLSPARSRLGRCRRRVEGRSGEDVAARAIDFELRKIERQLFPRRAAAGQRRGRQRPVEPLRQRLLGPPRLHPAARSQSAWRWRITWKRFSFRRISSASTPCWAERIHTRSRSSSVACLPRWIRTNRLPSSTRTTSTSCAIWSAARAKFVDDYYIPDVLAIAPLYKDWFSRGEGLGNFLSYGDYSSGDPERSEHVSVPARHRDGTRPQQSPARRSFEDHRIHRAFLVRIFRAATRTAIHPSQGETNPKYTGPKPPYDHLDVDAKYSWLKTPRYDGKPMEVGPLARMVVGYASGKKEIQDSVNGALKALNAPPAVLFSTLGRIAARALEAQIMAQQLEGWLNQLDDNLAHGKTTIFNPVRWDPGSWPKSASGYGWHEAPRGSLGHWVEIDGKVDQELPGGGSDHLECGAARCAGTARSL